MEKLNLNNKTLVATNKSYSFNKYHPQVNKDHTVLLKLSDTSGSFPEENHKNNSINDMDNTINYTNVRSPISKYKYSEYGKEIFNYLNISEILDENFSLKLKYDNLKKLKENLMSLKNKDKTISSRLTELSAESFTLSKIFADGMSEVSKELLKIHELQLDKIISSKILDLFRKSFRKFPLF